VRGEEQRGGKWESERRTCVCKTMSIHRTVDSLACTLWEETGCKEVTGGEQEG
jgi:hypothetical protein